MISSEQNSELIVHAAREARRFAPVFFCVQVATAGALWTQVDHDALLWWLVAAAANGIRMFVANHLEIRRFTAGDGDSFFRVRNVFHGVLGAAAWGVLPVIAEEFGSATAPPIAYLAVLAALCGVIFGTATSRLNFLAAVAGFVGPTVVATVVGFVDLSWLVVMVVLFGGLVVFIHAQLNDLVVAHVAATAENRSLAEQLADALDTEDRATGVLNRAGLARWLGQRPGQVVSVDVVEVERLDEIRWLFGNDRVDDMLAAFARGTSDSLGSDAVIARVSERHFTVCGAADQSSLILDELLASSFDSAAIELRLVKSSIVATESALADLDSAQIEAGGLGDRADLAAAPDDFQLALISQIPAAIENGSIEPWFQPIVDVQTGDITGWEALVRWRHPDHGMIAPALLLPVVSASGMMHVLTRSMIDRSVAFGARVSAAGFADASTVHVNVEPSDVRPGLRKIVQAALGRHGHPSDRLVIEITERHVIGIDDAMVEELVALRSDGVRIAVDDFGTGYSSLSHLFDLPIDCVKIDQRFISGAADGRASSAVVGAVVGLARGLQLSVVAEGVESDEQHSLLRDLGCDEFQGYLVSPAVPATDAVDLLSSTSIHVAAPN